MTESADEGGRQVRVFLLDDHEVVRRGVKDLLEADGGITVVGKARDTWLTRARNF